MYCYKIGGIGFGFDTEAELKESELYSLFRIGSDEFDELKDKHVYSFFAAENEYSGEGDCIFTSSSFSVYKIKEGYATVNYRVDGKSFQYIFYDNGSRGGDIYVTGEMLKKNVTSAELFRIIDTVGAFSAFNAFIFHSASVITDNGAILFSADSEGGKTTQAELWRREEACEILNGDRALIRYENGKFNVHGLPMCGSSGICLNRTERLFKIVFIEKDSSNFVEKLSNAEKLSLILSQTTVGTGKTEISEKLYSFLNSLISDVDIVSLHCTPDIRAVEALKEYIKAGGSE